MKLLLLLLMMAVVMAGCAKKWTEDDLTRIPCIFCKEKVIGGALKCRHCGSDPYNGNDYQRLWDHNLNELIQDKIDGKSKSSDDGQEKQTSDDDSGYVKDKWWFFGGWGCPILFIVVVVGFFLKRFFRYDIDPDLRLKDEGWTDEQIAEYNAKLNARRKK